jgi:hypothetical protein
MTSRLTALQKARKILSSCDEIEPRRHCAQPYLRSAEKNRANMSCYSSSKSVSNIKRDFSFRKSKSKLDSSVNSSSVCLKERKHSSNSFVSAYNKESRYDRIMRLKVNPKMN